MGKLKNVKNALEAASKKLDDIASKRTKKLYRGLESEYDPKFDLTKTDAPNDYSTWTDNPELAKQYGKNVYEIELPLSEMGDDYIDIHGERPLFFNNQKGAGIKGVTGDEYLIYQDHELFAPDMIRQQQALDMSQSARMQRAKEMGFDTDTTYYHGTGRKFEGFDLGADGEFSSPDTRGTATFTDDYSQAKRYSEESAEAEKVWDDEINRYISDGEPRVIEAYLPENIKAVDSEGMSHDSKWMIEQQNKAKSEGYSGIRFEGMTDDTFYNPMGFATNTTQVFDPSNIRSVNAAFDPAKKDSANLLAEAGTGIALGSMAMPEVGSFTERRKARGGTRRQRRLAQQEQRAREAQEQAFTEMIQNTPTDYDNRDTIQGAQYPFLGNVANTIRDIETPIGYPLRGAANWLDKINYGDDIGIMDRFEAIPDATEATIAINKVFGLDDDS